jgi:hypothetical protein
LKMWLMLFSFSATREKRWGKEKGFVSQYHLVKYKDHVCAYLQKGPSQPHTY